MLDRYQDIVENRKSASHLKARQVPIEDTFLSQLSEEKLWQIHHGGMRKHQSLLSEEKKRKPDISSPNLLDVKITLADRILERCHFCERRCGVNRKQGEIGFCGVEASSRYASEFLHMGEEPELIPSHTIFFTGCTFRCCYCQNWDIATKPDLGQEIEISQMAKVIKVRHQEGSKNVNWVGGNPDPNLYTILKIIKEVDENIPMIWNSNMYTSSEAMKLLDGIIDLYLGDFRYGNDECAKKYSEVSNYFSVVTRNFKEAAQKTDVILRHLVLPGHLECCTKNIFEWVKQEIPQVYVNLMFQYRPSFKASQYPQLNRILTSEERGKALYLASQAYLKGFC